MRGTGISWTVCKSAPRSRQITVPSPHHLFFTGRMPFPMPYQQHQSTDGTAQIPLVAEKLSSNSSNVIISGLYWKNISHLKLTKSLIGI